MAATKNTKVSKTASKTTKKATKKPVAKKPAAKKTVKKVAKKVVEKKEKVVRNRHFSIIYNGQRLSATPSGKRPKQAANKALTSIFASMDDKTKAEMIGKDINFALYENCKRRKNSKGVLTPRRIFRYTGKRTETAKQTGGKDISISHEVIVYCDKCKAMIEKLRGIETENQITKKQVIKNIKLYKKYIKSGKKSPINKHIEDHEKEYAEIVNCTSCKKEQKTITYKFTNTVKKTDDKALTEEDKKITTEFIDAIEEKLKAERKAAEEKKEKETKKEEKPVEKKAEKKETPKKETKPAAKKTGKK